IGQPRTLLPLSRSWFKGILLEAHWPYRRGQVKASLGFRQDADDLFFGESLFHCRSSLERTLHRHRTKRGEQVTTQMRPFFFDSPKCQFPNPTNVVRLYFLRGCLAHQR
ncbi:hypothetical protein, partial [Burkholderia pseudomallei]